MDSFTINTLWEWRRILHTGLPSNWNQFTYWQLITGQHIIHNLSNTGHVITDDFTRNGYVILHELHALNVLPRYLCMFLILNSKVNSCLAIPFFYIHKQCKMDECKNEQVFQTPRTTKWSGRCNSADSHPHSYQCRKNDKQDWEGLPAKERWMKECTKTKVGVGCEVGSLTCSFSPVGVWEEGRNWK